MSLRSRECIENVTPSLGEGVMYLIKWRSTPYSMVLSLEDKPLAHTIKETPPPPPPPRRLFMWSPICSKPGWGGGGGGGRTLRRNSCTILQMRSHLYCTHCLCVYCADSLKLLHVFYWDCIAVYLIRK